jgi:uncharacterized protein YcfL
MHKLYGRMAELATMNEFQLHALVNYIVGWYDAQGMTLGQA